MEQYSKQNTKRFVLTKNENNTWQLRALRKSSGAKIQRTPIIACETSRIAEELAEFLYMEGIEKQGIPVEPDKLFNDAKTQEEALKTIQEAKDIIRTAGQHAS